MIDFLIGIGFLRDHCKNENFSQRDHRLVHYVYPDPNS